MKTLLATASLLALLSAAPAQAQTTTTPPSDKPAATPTTPPPADASKPTTTPGATTPPGGTTPPSATTTSPTTDAAKKTDMPKSSSAAGGEYRASKLIGQTIRNAANESIGDINDLMVDSSGKIAAVIVGVGGFLGIGEKNVSVPFDKVSFSRDANNTIVATANLTKDSLQSAPEFRYPDDKGTARPATGTGGTAPSPGTGTSR